MRIKRFYLWEKLTWFSFVFIAALAVILVTPAHEDITLKIIILALLCFVIFWYLRSRQLYITSHKKFEKTAAECLALHDKVKLYEILEKDLPFGIVTFDADQRISFFSEKMSKITGYSESQALGRLSSQLLNINLESLQQESQNALLLDKSQRLLVPTKSGGKVSALITAVKLTKETDQYKTLLMVQEV